ncbi:hypothetical protein ACFLU6_15115, partial [Acidobacteriota bacterium]
RVGVIFLFFVVLILNLHALLSRKDRTDAQDSLSPASSDARYDDGVVIQMGPVRKQIKNKEGQKYTGDIISIDFKNTRVNDAFRFFSTVTGQNFMLDPAVSNKESVTLRLSDVPWDQALAVVCKQWDLGYIIDGNVVWIKPIEDIKKEARDYDDLLGEEGTQTHFDE